MKNTHMHPSETVSDEALRHLHMQQTSATATLEDPNATAQDRTDAIAALQQVEETLSRIIEMEQEKGREGQDPALLCTSEEQRRRAAELLGKVGGVRKAA